MTAVVRVGMEVSMNETGTNPSIRYDSKTPSGAPDHDDRHAIQTYVSDMLALERHIAQPLKRQSDMEQTKAFAGAAVIAQLLAVNQSHVTALEQRLTQLGGHAADPVKSAWSSLLGVGAGAIDSVRKTKISKSLRDDYTALSLATMGYTMLHATCVGLGDAATSDLAKRHLADYARLVMQINQVMPEVVLTELREDGESVAPQAAETIRRDTNDIWRAQSDVAR